MIMYQIHVFLFMSIVLFAITLFAQESILNRPHQVPFEISSSSSESPSSYSAAFYHMVDDADVVMTNIQYTDLQ